MVNDPLMPCIHIKTQEEIAQLYLEKHIISCDQFNNTNSNNTKHQEHRNPLRNEKVIGSQSFGLPFHFVKNKGAMVDGI